MKQRNLSLGILSGICLLIGLQIPAVHGENAELHTGRFSSYAQYRNASAAGRLIAANESQAAEVTETLPAYFDLRSQGLVSSIKSQGSY